MEDCNETSPGSPTTEEPEVTDNIEEACKDLSNSEDNPATKPPDDNKDGVLEAWSPGFCPSDPCTSDEIRCPITVEERLDFMKDIKDIKVEPGDPLEHLEQIPSYLKKKKNRGRQSIRGRRSSSTSHSSGVSTEPRFAPSRDGIIFEVGSRLRARDFSKQWYDAKIIDVNHDKEEVKIHFDRWNSRFDIWVKMDSSELKALSPDRFQKKRAAKTYNVGDEVLAKWKDGVMYPAVVKHVRNSDCYNVMFYDGFTHKVQGFSLEPMPSKYVGKLDFPAPSKAKKNFEKQVPVPEVVADIVQAAIHPLDSSLNISLDKSVATKEFIIEEDHNHFKCTFDDCGKSFRKEKLLESHYKHYHNKKCKPKPQVEESRLSSASSHKDTAMEIIQEVNLLKKAPELGPKLLEHKPAKIVEKKVVTIPKADIKPKSIKKKQETDKISPNPVAKKVVKSSPSVDKDSIPSFLPQRSSTRRISLPAKFANDEICLMAHFGRERYVSASERLSSSEFKSPSPRQNRKHSKEKPVEKADSPLLKSKKEAADSPDVSSHVDYGHSSSTAVLPSFKIGESLDPQKVQQMVTIASRCKNSESSPCKSTISTNEGSMPSTSTSLNTEVLPVVKKKNIVKPKILKVKFGKQDRTTKLLPKVDSGDSADEVIMEPVEKPAPVVPVEKEEPKLVVPELTEVELPQEADAVTPSQVNVVKDEESPKIQEVVEVQPVPEPKLELTKPPQEVFSPLKAALAKPLEIRTPTKENVPQVSPNSMVPSHIMCTRRKEALLEKEKVTSPTKLVGGHVMCTRKKSVKLPFDHRGKPKSSPSKNDSPYQRQVKRRRIFSPIPGGSEEHKIRPAEVIPDLTVDKKPYDSLVPEVVKAVPTADETKAPKPDMDELVHCICDSCEEEGLMMQCEICLTWQHGLCFNIEEEKDVPERYVCYACTEPKGLRESFRYRYDPYWFKRGELPALTLGSNSSKPQALASEASLKTHNLIGSLHTVFNVLHSVKYKIDIVSSESHPDLHLFQKSNGGYSTDETDLDEVIPESEGVVLADVNAPQDSLPKNKDKIISQNLVGFDHSYYSPEVAILDLDSMPLMTEEEGKSENGDSIEPMMTPLRGVSGTKDSAKAGLWEMEPSADVDFSDTPLVIDMDSAAASAPVSPLPSGSAEKLKTSNEQGGPTEPKTSPEPDDPSKPETLINEDKLAEKVEESLPKDSEPVAEPELMTVEGPELKTVERPELKTVEEPELKTVEEPELKTVEEPESTDEKMTVDVPSELPQTEEQSQVIADQTEKIDVDLETFGREAPSATVQQYEIQKMVSGTEGTFEQELATASAINVDERDLTSSFSEIKDCEEDARDISLVDDLVVPKDMDVMPSISFLGSLNIDDSPGLPSTSTRNCPAPDTYNDFNYSTKCKRNLMDHIKHALADLEPELDRIEELVIALEKEEAQLNPQPPEQRHMRSHKRNTPPTIYRRFRKLEKDLKTVQNSADLFKE